MNSEDILGTGSIDQWQSICLAYIRPWANVNKKKKNILETILKYFFLQDFLMCFVLFFFTPL
jgi:hypothetical protein